MSAQCLIGKLNKNDTSSQIPLMVSDVLVNVWTEYSLLCFILT